MIDIGNVQEALKKQIPMKIDIIDDIEHRYYICGACKSYQVQDNYCSECGQRIDWGE